MTVNSPFKFLDSYTKDDKDVFFGREEEVELLYQLVFQANLVLVYGQSGTGKTSLVQCGLANRFNATHWFDLHIRRNDDINKSLLNELRQYEIPSTSDSSLVERLRKRRKAPNQRGAGESTHSNEIVRRLRLLYKHYLKPIYLIFDQFEEIFILGSRAEQERFYANIADILASENYCRIIIIMREESIAQLYHFEKVVPLLFDKRMRVEPLSRSKTAEVITGTLKKYNIDLEEPSVTNSMVDLLSADQGRVELTYLQLFLDRLYQDAAANDPNKIIFTQQLIQQVGTIEDTLSDFLNKQTAVIQSQVEEAFPDISSSVVQKVLSAFVTLEGTKRPSSKAAIQVGKLDVKEVSFIVDHLEANRLLRFDNGLYELSHDVLARQIANDRSEAEITLLQIRKIVQDRYQAYATTRTLLNNNEAQLIKSFRDQLQEEKYFTEAEWAFVKRSIVLNRRRRILMITTVAAVITALAGLALYSNRQSQIAQENATLADTRLQEIQLAQEQQKAASYDKYLNEGKALMATSRYSEAILAFQTALDFDSLRVEARDSLQKAQSRFGASSQFEQLLAAGDAIFNQNDDALYIDALVKYKEALQLNFNNSLAESKINATNGKLAVAFERFTRDGDAFFNAANTFGYQMALKSYQQAARIRPSDTYIKNKLRATKQQLK